MAGGSACLLCAERDGLAFAAVRRLAGADLAHLRWPSPKCAPSRDHFLCWPPRAVYGHPWAWRGARARLHAREEILFYTGRRKPAREFLVALP
jgi:hypothetical protein